MALKLHQVLTFPSFMILFHNFGLIKMFEFKCACLYIHPFPTLRHMNVHARMHTITRAHATPTRTRTPFIPYIPIIVDSRVDKSRIMKILQFKTAFNLGSHAEYRVIDSSGGGGGGVITMCVALLLQYDPIQKMRDILRKHFADFWLNCVTRGLTDVRVRIYSRIICEGLRNFADCDDNVESSFFCFVLGSFYMCG